MLVSTTVKGHCDLLSAQCHRCILKSVQHLWRSYGGFTQQNDQWLWTACTRGIQKVRRLTHLITRYVCHVLSLFNIVSCNWNPLGPVFLQSSDSIVKELSILLFQPAICHADNVFPVKTANSREGSGPWSNTWFLGSPRVHTPNSILIGSAVFAGLMIATARDTLLHL